MEEKEICPAVCGCRTQEQYACMHRAFMHRAFMHRACMLLVLLVLAFSVPGRAFAQGASSDVEKLQGEWKGSRVGWSIIFSLDKGKFRYFFMAPHNNQTGTHSLCGGPCTVSEGQISMTLTETYDAVAGAWVPIKDPNTMKFQYRFKDKDTMEMLSKGDRYGWIVFRRGSYVKDALARAEREAAAQNWLTSTASIEEVLVAASILENVNKDEIVELIARCTLIGESSEEELHQQLQQLVGNIRTDMAQSLTKEKIIELRESVRERSGSFHKEIQQKVSSLKKSIQAYTAADSLVRVGSFFIQKTEVTQGFYAAVTGENPSRYTGDERLPLECVSWYDAVKFCNFLSMLQGLTPCYSVNGSTNTSEWDTDGKDNRTYDVQWNQNANGWRLPTEAEWLLAADDGHQYAGSDSIDSVAWYRGNSDGQPQKVGTRAANGRGIYDMTGNVGEWCWDKNGFYGIGCGGSWDSGESECAVSCRYGVFSLNLRDESMGFRMVRNAGKAE